MPEPLVSIVIPCYRGERYIEAAIASCLRQTWRELEVIVVDDASPDRCAEFAERMAADDTRIRVIRLPKNRNVAGAFNAGFEQARGAYFARLAQDDLFRETAIERMVRCLEEHREAGLVYGDQVLIDEAGREVGYEAAPPPEEVLRGRNGIGLCVMWPRHVWEAVGEFDSRFDTAEDFDYWMRIRKRFPVVRCEGDAPFLLRVHAQMGSKTFSDKQEVLAARILAEHSTSDAERRRHLATGHYNAAYHLRAEGRPREAWRHMWLALRAQPSHWPSWKLGAALCATACCGRRRPAGESAP